MENRGHQAQGQDQPLPVGKTVGAAGRQPATDLRHLPLRQADTGELPYSTAETEKTVPMVLKMVVISAVLYFLYYLYLNIVEIPLHQYLHYRPYLLLILLIHFLT